MNNNNEFNYGIAVKKIINILPFRDDEILSFYILAVN